MSNLVCVTGDFCSGSTLVFTLFRATGRFHCLYEPLHERLREYLIYGLRAEEQSHHFHVGNYYREFRGFDRASRLFDPRWGASRLRIATEAPADDLYRYFSYIVGMGFGQADRVMFKENRMPFRLEWFRARFPYAKIVHIHRPKEDQWRSIVRRVQAYHGREDVGQDSVHFTGFNVAAWCEDLKSDFPELDARHFRTGFERFSALWNLSFDHNRRHSDVSIDYRDLLRNFEPTVERLWHAIGIAGVDTLALKRLVVPPEKQDDMIHRERRLSTQAMALLDRALRRYARVRVRLEDSSRT